MIGILGGTFDPVHFGHIKPALELLRLLPLDEIRFIPCRIPPHRPVPVASPAQRWHMVNMVVGTQSALVADERELRRQGPSYTVDTLEELRAELGPAETLGLIMGSDAFGSFSGWHRWRDILRLAHLIVMLRPGSVPPQEGEEGRLLRRAQLDNAEQLTQSRAGGILPIEVTPLNISSTAIRACIRAGEPPRFMLPGPVWAYIKREGLYGARAGEH